MRGFPALLLFLFLSLAAVTSCISDSFTTSPSDLLSFSSDTVTFDTVFTGQGTPTARLKVYNRAKKAINISDIRFRNPQSGFSVNVDGVSGKDFQNVEIRGGDSIFIFIECFIPESSSSRPYLVEDQLLFFTNGVEQKVQVEAYGQNVRRLRAMRVSEDMTLTSDMPYVVFDSLVVERGATLRIEPGADILFHDKASLAVYGTLEAVGAPGHLINMRGDRLDNVLPGVGYDILAGQWKGIRIHKDSYGNRMEYVDMRSTVQGLVADSCGDISRSKLLLVNSWLHNSQSNVLKSVDARIDAYGCVFSEAAAAVVSLAGGLHEFTQCTFSNNYLFSAITEPLLCLYHIREEPGAIGDGARPYMSAHFRNSIFYGLPSDINAGDLDGTDVYLSYCSLKSAGSDDEHFVSCLWDTDPLFLTRRADYYFNYEVEAGSPVIGAGDPTFVTGLCVTDINGVDRLEHGNPTLGAYAR